MAIRRPRTSSLEIADHGRVRVLTLNRPEKLNALDRALSEAVLSAAAAADRDAGIGAVVLAGKGRAFCAGADLKGLADLTTARAVRAHAALGARLQSAFRDLAKPVIAAVHGYAFGAGCGLVAASDMAIAGERARFGYPEITRNVLPALVLPSLVRQVGRKAAFGLIATGLPVTADAALSLGLVNRVVPDDAVLDEAIALAQSLAGRDPHTLRRLKRLFAQVAEQPFDTAMRTATAANAQARLERMTGKTGARRATPRHPARSSSR